MIVKRPTIWMIAEDIISHETHRFQTKPQQVDGMIDVRTYAICQHSPPRHIAPNISQRVLWVQMAALVLEEVFHKSRQFVSYETHP